MKIFKSFLKTFLICALVAVLLWILSVAQG